jgi:hypothetical protein
MGYEQALYKVGYKVKWVMNRPCTKWGRVQVGIAHVLASISALTHTLLVPPKHHIRIPPPGSLSLAASVSVSLCLSLCLSLSVCVCLSLCVSLYLSVSLSLSVRYWQKFFPLKAAKSLEVEGMAQYCSPYHQIEVDVQRIEVNLFGYRSLLGIFTMFSFWHMLGTLGRVSVWRCVLCCCVLCCADSTSNIFSLLSPSGTC